MKKLALVVIAMFAFTWIAAQQQTATGYVFVDLKKDGKKNRREQGLEGVAVSNGRQVTLTDARGRYELPVGDDNILFVIKPSGYESPLNEYYQRQSFYIHKPQGSPELIYDGVSPTGPLPSSIDFPLYQADEQDEFSILVFGDPQIYDLQELEYFRKGIVDELTEVKGISFGITLGDLVGDHLVLHRPYLEAISQMKLPWHHVLGNHDINFDVTADSLSDETFEKNFGPANYSFNYGNAHFIVLDNVLYPDPRDGNGYWGGFREDQLEFVKNNLKFVPKDKLIVLAFHIPLLHHNENSFRNADRQTLFELLKDYPNTLSLSAHTHLQRHNFYGQKDGLQQDAPHHEFNAGTTSGDWYSGGKNNLGVPVSTMRDGTPRGYSLLRVSGNKYEIDYKVAGAPAGYQIKLFHPQVVAQGRNIPGGLVANFFMGKNGDKVQFRINNGKWTNMAYFSAYDPSYVVALNEWNVSQELIEGRRPSNPVNSTHLWQANIPAGRLAAGEHTIEVRATDMFGRTFTETSTFRVEETEARQGATRINKRPRVIAHRGHWNTPGSAQNSIASLIKADSIGSYGTEFDVWLSADDVPVLNHDADFKGLIVEETTAAQLMKQKLANGENLPSLEQFLDIAKPLDIRLVLELKPHSSPERESKAVDIILAIVADKGLNDRVDYISFSKHIAKRFAEKAPKSVSVQYLGRDLSPTQLSEMGILGADFNYQVYQNNPQWLKDLKALGMTTNVWTVNDPQHMLWCIDNGLDFITTDDPEAFLKLFR